MIQYKVVSELFQKLRLPIYASQFMLIIPVLSDPFNLETTKEGEKLRNVEYLWKEKSF